MQKKFPELISDYSNVAGYKGNIQKSIAFLYVNNEPVEFEVKDIIPFTLSSKKFKFRYTFNKT